MPRTEEEVAAAVQKALHIVEETNVPEDLRRLAFEKIFISLLGEAAESGEARVRDAPRRASSSGGEGRSERAAAKLGVDEEVLERVLDFDEDGVHVMVPRSRFAKQKSVAIHQLATLVVAARQASGLDDEWTPQSAVRQATEDLGVEDPSNFATYMRRLRGMRARGSGKSGALKMNSVGYEAAAALIRELDEGGA